MPMQATVVLVKVLNVTFGPEVMVLPIGLMVLIGLIIISPMR